MEYLKLLSSIKDTKNQLDLKNQKFKIGLNNFICFQNNGCIIFLKE